MNVRDLTVKFTTYAHFLAPREWLCEGFALPLLSYATPDIAQERPAQTTLAKTPGGMLCTTTASLLAAYGPLATVWMRHLGTKESDANSDIRNILKRHLNPIRAI